MHLPLKEYWTLLVTYLQPRAARVVLLTGLLLSSIALQLVNPQVIRYFLDTVQAKGPESALLNAAGLFIVLALGQRAINVTTIYVGENLGWAATNQLRADLALHLLRLDMSFHNTHTPGELISRVDGDVTALANFFSQFVIRLLGNAVLMLGILLFLFREDWRVGIALAVYAILTLIALGTIQNLGASRWRVADQDKAELLGFIEERISGTEDIRANGGEPYVMQRLYGFMRNLLRSRRLAFMMGTLSEVSTRLLFVIGYAGGLALGAWLYTQGRVTVGAAYVIVYYIGLLATPLEAIRQQSQDLQHAASSIHRVNELSRLHPTVQDSVLSTEYRVPRGALSVAFEHVSFAYSPKGENGNLQNSDPRSSILNSQSSEFTLKDISLRVPAGRVLGVLGRTGSGKTTLTRLLFRLYDANAGCVRLNDLDIRDLALAELRSHVGMVTQDVQLFQANIRDNLTFFNRRIADTQIRQALQDLGLWAWFQALPAGLDTPLDAGGKGLSAGQAQLLAFARVFLANPGLVILDEASSRLDPLTEHLLEQAMDRLLRNRTGIIIAHRLATVQRADDILILEAGRIVEYGTRTQLAANPRSRFAGLLTQALEQHQPATLEEVLA